MEAAAVTIANIFEAAQEVMGGIVGLTTDFFTSLWANPMGKLTIALSIVGAGIGLCTRLFLRKKHV